MAAKPAAAQAVVNTDSRERVVFRVQSDQKQRIAYWADRHEQKIQEYVEEAVAQKIERENGDYDLPTLEIARLNQIADETKALAMTVANLERSFTSAMDSLLGMARGDNTYLLDEDGELDEGSDS